jgi:hypothetical protein
MLKKNAIALVLVGLVLGCGAATVSPISTVFAEPAAGTWQCYQSNEFPDATKAANYKDAINATQGMNAVAKHVPAGTVTTFALDGSNSGSEPDVVCVKH